MRRVFGVLMSALAVVCTPLPAAAQIQTGSITGTVADASGAVLPGVGVSVSGDRLIGGAQSQNTDANGAYRFDRLPPGAYVVKFELQGFKTVVREDIRVNATFTATVNARLEVGQLQETITVTGESPIVDTKSNVQQTVMSQELLEGVPTGRDPWSVAKIIPGVAVSTYDVGGTQGMQQSTITSRGSNGDDKIFAIDGLNINWPGGGGGSTMVYYDQGMFEEVNFQTSAIPAEVAIGGVYMNMVMKEGGNKWRGDAKYFWAGPDTQAENHETTELQGFRNADGSPAFAGGNPVTKQYDLNLSGGGAARQDRVWLFMAYRDWRVDKLQLGAKNPDGSNAIDDNRIRNYSGKITWQMTPNHKVSYSHNYNNKQRFHRRNRPIEEDRASWIQNQFGYSLATKYTAVLGNRTVFDSGFGYMHGTFPLHYQKEVGPNDIRIEDTVLDSGSVAAPYNYDNPNSRVQFDNTVSFNATGAGGTHALKAGVQIARQFFSERWAMNGDLIIRLNDGRPNAVIIYNTPTQADNYVLQTGYFVQDTWTIGRKLTLNLGFRYDTADGWIPAADKPAGRFDRFVTGPLSTPRLDVISQGIGVWRTGVVYDVFGTGRTAAKANVSRYGSNVGIDRVLTVNPFNFTNGSRAWSDPNGDRVPQESELGAFSGFAANRNRYAEANGPDWPYSDEISAGVEHQLLRNLRVGAMYYHRTNRNRIGQRNVAVPSTAYTEHQVAVPGPPTGPSGTFTFYNLNSAFFGGAFLENVYDNEEILDTDYDGVELTAVKRFSDRWQLLAGLTLGRNEGGVVTGDLNDPNNALTFPEGIVGNDSKYSIKVAGSYLIPWGEVMVSGSLLRNEGFPYSSSFRVTRTVFPTLTRADQVIARLAERGDERYPDVTLLDLRFSRPFRLGRARQINVEPLVELFNLGNASTIVARNSSVGSRYLFPTEILSPRIVRVGFSVTF
jgi:hypothetical protein